MVRFEFFVQCGFIFLCIPHLPTMCVFFLFFWFAFNCDFRCNIFVQFSRANSSLGSEQWMMSRWNVQILFIHQTSHALANWHKSLSADCQLCGCQYMYELSAISTESVHYNSKGCLYEWTIWSLTISKWVNRDIYCWPHSLMFFNWNTLVVTSALGQYEQ